MHNISYKSRGFKRKFRGKHVKNNSEKKIETKKNEYSKDERRRSLNAQQRRSEGFRGRVIGSTRQFNHHALAELPLTLNSSPLSPSNSALLILFALRHPVCSILIHFLLRFGILAAVCYVTFQLPSEQSHFILSKQLGFTNGFTSDFFFFFFVLKLIPNFYREISSFHTT